VDSTVRKGEHTDVTVTLSFPIGEFNDLLHLVKHFSRCTSPSFLKVIAFVGGVESEYALLLENLEVVQDDQHTHSYLALFVIKEKHEVHLQVFERVAQGRSETCLALELLTTLDPAHHSQHVKHTPMLCA
jgi:hypothetical protein